MFEWLMGAQIFKCQWLKSLGTPDMLYVIPLVISCKSGDRVGLLPLQNSFLNSQLNPHRKQIYRFIHSLIHLRRSLLLPLWNPAEQVLHIYDNICPHWRKKNLRQHFPPLSFMFPLCHQSCWWLAAKLFNRLTGWLAGCLASWLCLCDWLRGRLTEWMMNWVYN